MWFLLAIGIAGALGTAAWSRSRGPQAEPRIYVMILVAMQALYLGFVFVQPSGGALAVEAAVLVVFLGLAASGRRMAWILPVGYVLHGFWDLRHGALVTAYVPSGYPELCVAYDWALALYLVTRLRAFSSADGSGEAG